MSRDSNGCARDRPDPATCELLLTDPTVDVAPRGRTTAAPAPDPGRHPGVVGALEIAAGVAVLAGAALQSATGFGFALASAPLLFAAADRRGRSAADLLGLLVNLMTLGTEGRRPQPRVRDSVSDHGVGGPGRRGRAARAARARLDHAAGRGHARRVRDARGAGARPAAARPGGGARRRGWAAPATGFASGALTTSTNTAGPPVVLYMLARGATPVQTRDRLTTTFSATRSRDGGAGAEPHRRCVPPADALAALVPAMVTGHLRGRRVFARIADDRYEPVLTAVLVATALAGLATAVL